MRLGAVSSGSGHSCVQAELIYVGWPPRLRKNTHELCGHMVGDSIRESGGEGLRKKLNIAGTLVGTKRVHPRLKHIIEGPAEGTPTNIPPIQPVFLHTIRCQSNCQYYCRMITIKRRLVKDPQRGDPRRKPWRGQGEINLAGEALIGGLRQGAWPIILHHKTLRDNEVLHACTRCIWVHS